MWVGGVAWPRHRGSKLGSVLRTQTDGGKGSHTHPGGGVYWTNEPTELTMIETTIQRTGLVPGEPITIPADVLATVEQADQILREQLGRVNVPLIRATWDRFQDRGPEGWSVMLRLGLDIDFSEREIFANQIRDRVAAKDQIREAVSDFGRAISTQAREQLRQIRADLKQLRDELATTPS